MKKPISPSFPKEPILVQYSYVPHQKLTPTEIKNQKCYAILGIFLDAPSGAYIAEWESTETKQKTAGILHCHRGIANFLTTDSEPIPATQGLLHLRKSLRRTQEVESLPQEQYLLVASKYFLRQKIYRIWKDLSDEKYRNISIKAFQSLITHPRFLAAEVILAYFPDRKELEYIPELCQQFPEKKFAFSRITEKKMEFFVDNVEALQLGPLGVLETQSQIPAPIEKVDLILTPAVAVGQDKSRMGRGGGFYDRFLQQHQNLYKLSVMPDFAVPETIPAEPHDQKVNELITISTQ